MENSRYHAALALILFKILVMGSMPRMKIYPTDVLDLASFLHERSSSPVSSRDPGNETDESEGLEDR